MPWQARQTAAFLRPAAIAFAFSTCCPPGTDPMILA